MSMERAGVEVYWDDMMGKELGSVHIRIAEVRRGRRIYVGRKRRYLEDGGGWIIII